MKEWKELRDLIAKYPIKSVNFFRKMERLGEGHDNRKSTNLIAKYPIKSVNDNLSEKK